jgi:hypothetical protein
MGYYYYDYALFEDLKGRTIKAIEVERTNDDYIKFAMDNGDVFRMDHHQECCEHVYIEDICGDLEDLIDTPILVAEERTEDEPEGGEWGDISGWTFYELRTIKGSVTIRWHGSSNGYYSIGVGFVKLKGDTEEQKLAA